MKIGVGEPARLRDIFERKIAIASACAVPIRPSDIMADVMPVMAPVVMPLRLSECGLIFINPLLSLDSLRIEAYAADYLLAVSREC